MWRDLSLRDVETRPCKIIHSVQRNNFDDKISERKKFQNSYSFFKIKKNVEMNLCTLSCK